mgnify:CR=1 FL=1
MEHEGRNVIPLSNRTQRERGLHIVQDEPDDKLINVANLEYFSGIIVRADGSVIHFVHKPPPILG